MHTALAEDERRHKMADRCVASCGPRLAVAPLGSTPQKHILSNEKNAQGSSQI